MSEIQSAAFIAARRMRDLLLTVPARISAVVAGLSDSSECERVIDAEVRRALDDFEASLAGVLRGRSPA